MPATSQPPPVMAARQEVSRQPVMTTALLTAKIRQAETYGSLGAAIAKANAAGHQIVTG